MKVLLLFTFIFCTQTNASTIGQFFSSSSSSTGAGTVTFDRDSTWTVPAGVTKINVQITGGGGGSSIQNGGGGGGGGSCIKNGSTVLASANGGRGAHYTENVGQRGSVTQTALTVTAGSTLNIYVGGGGGGAGYYAYSGNVMAGGGGGYGACGTGGAGGNTNSGVTGGTSASGYGGGGGAGYDSTNGYVAGSNATSSTGGAGANTGGGGGTASAGGASSYGGGGGGSGGIGGNGVYYYYTTGKGFSITARAGAYASNLMVIDGYITDSSALFSSCSYVTQILPGSGGNKASCTNQISYGQGGSSGFVSISW